MALRAEQPGELDELRRLNDALAALPRASAPERAQLRSRRATEVRRLRRLPVRPWSHGQLADALGVSRASIQQWENPDLDKRRRLPGGHAPPAVWIGTAASLATSPGWHRVLCHFCHHAGRLWLG